MGTNVTISIPEFLGDLVARDVGITTEEFSDESFRQYGCWIVFEDLKLETSILRQPDGNVYLTGITFRVHTFPAAKPLYNKLVALYGRKNVQWHWE
jgi:hypothetical protein